MTDNILMALPLLVFLAVLLLIGYCERYTRRNRPNRRKAGFIPDPDSRAVVGNWWRDCPPVERR